MRFNRVRIAGMGHDLPPKVITSAAIEDRLSPVYERIGLLPGRLELMTGIHERRYWPGEGRPSTVAAAAGTRALGDFDRAKIGCLVHASVCRDFLEPATASVVHDRLGLPPRCQVFDLSNACLGVANAMLVVAQMVESGVIEAGLVVAGENGKPLLDSTIDSLVLDLTVTRKSIKGVFPSLTIGSGAAAVLLASEDLAPDAPKLLGGVVEAATEHHRLCQGGEVTGVGHGDTGVTGDRALDMRTDAEALLHAGLALAKQTWPRFLHTVGWTAGSANRTVTHQVGKAHTKAMYETLGLALDSGYTTYDRLGNVGSVSLPITLSMAVDDHFVGAGDRVALLGIGSGISTAMLGVQW